MVKLMTHPKGRVGNQIQFYCYFKVYNFLVCSILGLIRRMNELRKANPHLTTMISLGGWSEGWKSKCTIIDLVMTKETVSLFSSGSTKYSEMVRNAENRKIFVDSVLKFLQRFDLDGIDLDW